MFPFCTNKKTDRCRSYGYYHNGDLSRSFSNAFRGRGRQTYSTRREVGIKRMRHKGVTTNMKTDSLLRGVFFPANTPANVVMKEIQIMAMPYKEPRRFSIRIRFFVSKYKTSMAKCSTIPVCSQHNQHGLCYHIHI